MEILTNGDSGSGSSGESGRLSSVCPSPNLSFT